MPLTCCRSSKEAKGRFFTMARASLGESPSTAASSSSGAVLTETDVAALAAGTAGSMIGMRRWPLDANVPVEPGAAFVRELSAPFAGGPAGVALVGNVGVVKST